jgi:hypothetical protein
MKLFISLIMLFSVSAFAEINFGPKIKAPDAQFYRDLTLKIRNSGEFTIPFPGVQSSINYSFDFGQPVYDIPMIGDTQLNSKDPYFYRIFFDRILFKDGAYLEVNGEKLPLTCIFISGQDNRFADKKLYSPLLPEFVLKVYLVANDFSCQGPITPGWPETGGKEQHWDTYLYYEIKDPTIMLPMDAKLRYRWNEYNVVLVDRGGK